MAVAIIDADLIGRKNHRFPNLALMKISSFLKQQGKDVSLELGYERLDDYEEVYVSKVFTDTPFPDIQHKSLHLGGTGFYFDKAPPLPYEIEHSMPDYTLYDQWLLDKPRTTAYKEYRDYSIGFTTRGCFRKCGFCVNQNYDRVIKHSPLEEFVDPGRKKICLLDDNILGYPGWRQIFEDLIETGKPFKYKQGMDERLLTDEKCRILFNCRYDGHFTFAFDNVEDYDLIQQKLEMVRKYHTAENVMFYVLCGFKSTDIDDINGVFKRIELLMRYKCIPYVLRYQSPTFKPYMQSEFKETYIAIARWCNQPSLFKKKSFREYCELVQRDIKTEGKLCSPMRGLKKIEGKVPERYLDMKWGK